MAFEAPDGLVQRLYSHAKDDGLWVIPRGNHGGGYADLAVDTDGHLQVDILTGGGGGTQYTEDAVAAADPVGNAQILVRDDALSGQTTADGDNVAARGTDKGELYVKHADAIDTNATVIATRNDDAATETQAVNLSPSVISVDNKGRQEITGTTTMVPLLTDGSATTQPVSGPLTDTELRATAVPVSGTVTASGPLTDTELRASAVPVSAASLPLPSGASTSAAQAVQATEASPTNIDDVYDNTTSTNTSAAIDCSAYRAGLFSCTLAKAGTGAHYIIISFLFSGATTNYMKLLAGGLSSLIYDDNTIGTGLEIAIPVPLMANSMKIKIDAVSVSSSLKVTVTNSSFYMRD